jgi:hypothetical protein
MPRLSFTLRDVFWLTLVVGLAIGWCVDRNRLSIQLDLMTKAQYETAHRWHQTEGLLRTEGYTIGWQPGPEFMKLTHSKPETKE